MHALVREKAAYGQLVPSQAIPTHIGGGVWRDAGRCRHGMTILRHVHSDKIFTTVHHGSSSIGICRRHGGCDGLTEGRMSARGTIGRMRGMATDCAVEPMAFILSSAIFCGSEPFSCKAVGHRRRSWVRRDTLAWNRLLHSALDRMNDETLIQRRCQLAVLSLLIRGFPGVCVLSSCLAGLFGIGRSGGGASPEDDAVGAEEARPGADVAPGPGLEVGRTAPARRPPPGGTRFRRRRLRRRCRPGRGRRGRRRRTPARRQHQAQHQSRPDHA